MTQLFGVHGWPLISSLRFPGETCLACPKCGSRNVMMSVHYVFPGTGPCGRGRLGDSGNTEYAQCQYCGCDSRNKLIL